MAAAQGRLSDDAGGTDEAKGAQEEARHNGNKGSTAPSAFTAAVEALGRAALRPRGEVPRSSAHNRVGLYAEPIESPVVSLG
ncbi:DUF3000 domain-containing protein, partial [Streptomyces olivaceus]